MRVSLQYWLELIFRRRARVSRVAMTVFGIVLALSMLLPPLYESTCKILVQPSRAQLLVSPGMQESTTSQPTVLAAPVTEQDLNSEVELLTGRYLVERALNRMTARHEGGIGEAIKSAISGIVSAPTRAYRLLHDAPAITPVQEEALKIERRLFASVILRSNVIEISFKSHDPVWSQEFLSHLVDEYIEFHASISHDPEAERFFQQQASLLRERLDRSEEKLRALELQTGITSLDDQKEALVNQLSSFEADYRKNEAQLAAVSRQVESLEAQMAANPRRITKETKVVQNMALTQLKPQILQFEAERAELLSRYKPSSERIREIDAKLAAAKAVVAREDAHEVQETSSDINPTWETLDSNLAQAKVTEASLAKTQEALAKEIDAYKLQLRALTADGMEVERFERDVEANKEAYLSYLRKGEEARAAQALNQNKILNVSVAQPPSTPLNSVLPATEINLIMGLVLALMLGGGAAYWEERRDPRIYSEAEIAEVSGLPTVGVFDHDA